MFQLIPEELLVAGVQLFCACLATFATLVTWLFLPKA